MTTKTAAPITASADRFDKSAMRHAILVAVRASLAQDVIPRLSSEQDVVTGHLLIRLLDYIEEHNREMAPSLVGRDGLPADLARDLADLTGCSVAGDNLAEIAGALAHLAAMHDPVDAARRQDFLARLSTHEAASLATLDAHEGVADPYSKGVIELGVEGEAGLSTPPLTDEGLTAAIRRGGLFGPDATAHSIVEIPGGFNKVTAAFTI
ncbi:MAG: hypothetical protein P8Y58_14990, partial [Novosphingobium sp.]